MFQLLGIMFGTKVCYSFDSICLDGYISQGRVYLSIDALDSNPYTGLGFGTSMADADILTFEKVQGQLFIKARKTEITHTRPPVINNPDLLIHSMFSDDTRRYANISRSLIGSGGYTYTVKAGLNNLIWSYGDVDSFGNIVKHTAKGAQPNGLLLAENSTVASTTVSASKTGISASMNSGHAEATVYNRTAEYNKSDLHNGTTAIRETSVTYGPLQSSSDKINLSDTTVFKQSTSTYKDSLTGWTTTRSLSQTCLFMSVVCVSGYYNNTNIYLTLDASNSNNWIGLGFGSSMTSADIITFELINSNILVNARKASGYARPPIVTDVGLNVISASIINGRRIVKFSLPMTPIGSFSNVIKDGKNDLIYAYGPISNGIIQEHDRMGSVQGM
eukprot:NODE_24_length_36516_cov_0.652470.p9 type:complete len:389 gc:universal NODE_24_length_36516_cov_0.652470:11497-10331(-)